MGPNSWRLQESLCQVFQSPGSQCHIALMGVFCFPIRGYGPELACRSKNGHSSWGWLGLVPREAQGASLTGAELRPCFAGKVGGWGSKPSRLFHHPFQELHVLYFTELLWQMKNQNRSSFRYWASRQLYLPNGNQWMSTLMEVLVFFMVLITSKSRIRKSFRSGIIGDLDLGNLEKWCCQPF